MKRSRRGFSAGAASLLATVLAGGLGPGCKRAAPPKGVVRLWYSYGGRNRKVLLKLVDAFHAHQSGVRVEATFQGDYFEGLTKLRTGMFVGAPPTISHVVGEVLPYLAHANVLQPLDDVGANSIADLEVALSQKGTFDAPPETPTFGLPFNRSTPVGYINQRHFEAKNLTPPTTWDELRATAKELSIVRGGERVRHGFECPIDWWFWVALMAQAGGTLFDRDGRLTLGGEAGERALSLWQTMVHRDESMKPPPGRDYNAWEATNSDFLAGRVSMIWTSTAFLRYLEDNASFPVKTVALPAESRSGVFSGGTFFVMPRQVDGAERDAGLAFLRFMMAPAQANAWATQTGYMPVSRTGRETLSEQGYYKDHPNDEVTLKQLASARLWPWRPNLFRIQREAVQPRLEQAVMSRASVADVMAEARRIGNMP